MLNTEAMDNSIIPELDPYYTLLATAYTRASESEDWKHIHERIADIVSKAESIGRQCTELGCRIKVDKDHIKKIISYIKENDYYNVIEYIIKLEEKLNKTYKLFNNIYKYNMIVKLIFIILLFLISYMEFVSVANLLSATIFLAGIAFGASSIVLFRTRFFDYALVLQEILFIIKDILFNNYSVLIFNISFIIIFIFYLNIKYYIIKFRI